MMGESMPIALTVYRTNRKRCYDESQSILPLPRTCILKILLEVIQIIGKDHGLESSFYIEETLGDTFTLSIYESGYFRDLTVTGFNSDVKQEPFDARFRLGSRSSTYSVTFCAELQEHYWHEYGWR
jgi:hypothetical protein